MALEGTLRDFSFADILQLISLQRKTGVLTLRANENLVTVSFQDGCIVGASTLNQHTEDMIGLILLKRGEVTEARFFKSSIGSSDGPMANIISRRKPTSTTTVICCSRWLRIRSSWKALG